MEIIIRFKRYIKEKGGFEKMIKIGVFILFVVVSLNGYWWFQSRKQMNRIIDLFESHYSDENFYFLGGLSYIPALFLGVKYRGVLYSDSLKEMEYPGGLYMELTGKSNGVGYLDTYKVFKDVIKIDRLAEEIARDIFGKYTTLTNEFGISRSPENIIKKLWNNIAL